MIEELPPPPSEREQLRGLLEHAQDRVDALRLASAFAADNPVEVLAGIVDQDRAPGVLVGAVLVLLDLLKQAVEGDVAIWLDRATVSQLGAVDQIRALIDGLDE